MTDPSQHPQLRQPLVVEALFEIRFESDQPYGIVPGRLYAALGEEFPEAKELTPAGVPEQVLPGHMVRHRFSDRGGRRLFQVGPAVLSINNTGYKGYESFSSDCNRVVEAARSIGLLKNIKRLGLRYINKAPLDRPWDKIVSIRVKAPSLLESSAAARHFRWLSSFDGGGMMSTNIAWPVSDDGNETIVIDFEYYREQAEVLSIKDLVPWRDAAHNRIYAAFRACLREEYFDSLEKK